MGVPVAAEGSFYVVCPAGGPTTLEQSAGAKGDMIDWLWLEAGAGTIALIDGGTTLFTWDGQTAERFIPLQIRSREGAWSVTTTGGLTALAAGAFS
jgi:hypothetical protein